MRVVGPNQRVSFQVRCRKAFPVGETHDNLHAHRVELLILRELYRRYPGKVAIGMEMFREPDQEILDRWTKGELPELEFLKATLPEVGLPDPYQRAAMKAVYGAHLPSEGMFEAFFRVQLLWEETMAVRVVDYLRRMPMPYAIVLPEEINIPADFVWWVPYEGLEGKRVAMGVRLVEKDNEVLVEGVMQGSPAEKAGILTGDRIFSFDG
ncbi:MAG TPA: ChaN family lipoprotein [Candidatus Deferrimicrobiaceae bacterium]|nr:ChaN family lipoprotein [Candidatus Deferrimicrobiaceae bacterium]